MKSILVLLGILSMASVYAQEEVIKEKPSQILSLQPIVIGAYSESSVMGIGLSYEREISNKMAWQLPVQYYFKGNGYGYEGFGISPTLKLYPFGMDRTVTWSVGPGLRYSIVKDYNYYNYYYNNSGQYQNYTTEKVFSVFGFELQSGLGVNIDRFNFGVNSSLGLNYTQGITGTFINTMTMGIRF